TNRSYLSSKDFGLCVTEAYRTKNHCKYLITYHVIFVVKYRKKLLDQYGEDIKINNNICIKKP
ncbi:MAG TPA: hypothetical protein VJ024_09065, partial [Thermodesulfovibrionales bacterium]|nr:hypothetical protein [Thermodesulfovibrionales bacterium]